ncbi:MAG TPA: SirB2 family protein [Burkholderiales bacterium]
MSADAYQILKYLHVGAVILSLAGFALRGVLRLAGSPLLGRRFTRIAPHVVDTVLLASAVALAWRLGQAPFVDAWLTAKVLALPPYIVLGAIALGGVRPRRTRALAFTGALLAAAYIVCVALTRDPRGPWLLVAGG